MKDPFFPHIPHTEQSLNFLNVYFCWFDFFWHPGNIPSIFLAFLCFVIESLVFDYGFTSPCIVAPPTVIGKSFPSNGGWKDTIIESIILLMKTTNPVGTRAKDCSEVQKQKKKSFDLIWDDDRRISFQTYFSSVRFASIKHKRNSNFLPLAY